MGAGAVPGAGVTMRGAGSDPGADMCWAAWWAAGTNIPGGRDGEGSRAAIAAARHDSGEGGSGYGLGQGLGHRRNGGCWRGRRSGYHRGSRGGCSRHRRGLWRGERGRGRKDRWGGQALGRDGGGERKGCIEG
ncbi:hypothetical protein B0H17DRAFT_1146970 [Mycena rosella]|uniref:Uncharacterized protein n=1 Tax=Mycena rosella TaxID=1033263 RepID=A0AAD7G3X6_MYCRO|nr:hypothetical protein B0H17DRAFT_1146970 [Mycena rosella]